MMLMSLQVGAHCQGGDEKRHRRALTIKHHFPVSYSSSASLPAHLFFTTNLLLDEDLHRIKIKNYLQLSKSQSQPVTMDNQ